MLLSSGNGRKTGLLKHLMGEHYETQPDSALFLLLLLLLEQTKEVIRVANTETL